MKTTFAASLLVGAAFAQLNGGSEAYPGAVTNWVADLSNTFNCSAQFQTGNAVSNYGPVLDSLKSAGVTEVMLPVFKLTPNANADCNTAAKAAAAVAKTKGLKVSFVAGVQDRDGMTDLNAD